MTVKLTTDCIRVIALFEQVTNVHAKDCLIFDDEIYFVVDEKYVGKAIGKNGSNMRNLRNMMNNRHVKVFACSNDLEQSVKLMVPQAKKIEIDGNSVVITVQRSEKVAVIGKSGRNINAIREVLKRRFHVKKVKLI